jgi:hypothetical protein
LGCGTFRGYHMDGNTLDWVGADLANYYPWDTASASTISANPLALGFVVNHNVFPLTNSGIFAGTGMGEMDSSTVNGNAMKCPGTSGTRAWIVISGTTDVNTPSIAMGNVSDTKIDGQTGAFGPGNWGVSGNFNT